MKQFLSNPTKENVAMDTTNRTIKFWKVDINFAYWMQNHIGANLAIIYDTTTGEPVDAKVLEK